jgi:PLP dependent protein
METGSGTEISSAVHRWSNILHAVHRAADDSGRPQGDVTLIAVSKTYPMTAIQPVLDAGQRVFGENYVQEAVEKWAGARQSTPDLELHMIGPLQSNKSDDAVRLFDVIHTLDRPSLAAGIAKAFGKSDRRPRLLVQVNTGNEPQKAGIAPDKLGEFLALCHETHGLKIAGLTCIPPVDEPPSPHFAFLHRLAATYSLPLLSMGMSADFEQAIMLGATHVRVGSAIFGARN